MRPFIKTLFFLMWIQSIVVYAEPVSELNGLLNNVKTMQANFSQVTYDNHGKAVQKSYGRIQLQRPGQFRWEITKPLPQLIIANQARLLIYDPDLEQVTIRPLNTAAGDTPAILLSHNETLLEKNYRISPATNQSGLRWYTLIPKNSENLFLSISLGFDGGKVKEIRLVDHLGHTLKIQFNHLRVNAALPASVFEFKKPPHTDVIDER